MIAHSEPASVSNSNSGRLMLDQVAERIVKLGGILSQEQEHAEELSDWLAG